MPLARVLEPEVMDTAEEASDYDAMAHDEVNARFCEDLLAFTRGAGLAGALRVVDVGTGTALIPIAMARRDASATIVAVDMAEHMLAVARTNVERAGLTARITLAKADAKGAPFADGAFDVVVSNSIVHHIPSPAVALAEMVRLARPGGALFVRDLVRPDNDADVALLVALHAAEPTGLHGDARTRHARQRDLFEASLRAALTLDEVRAAVAPLGVPAQAVTATSDRHWTLAHVKRA